MASCRCIDVVWVSIVYGGGPPAGGFGPITLHVISMYTMRLELYDEKYTNYSKRAISDGGNAIASYGA
jgi:hypothetical protein